MNYDILMSSVCSVSEPDVAFSTRGAVPTYWEILANNARQLGEIGFGQAVSLQDVEYMNIMRIIEANSSLVSAVYDEESYVIAVSISPKNLRMLLWLRDYMNTPDDMGDDWWREFDMFIRDNPVAL